MLPGGGEILKNYKQLYPKLIFEQDYDESVNSLPNPSLLKRGGEGGEFVQNSELGTFPIISLKLDMMN
jgi:hypothetical protein